MKPTRGKQLPGMELHLRHHSSCRLPTGCLIEKAFVPHDGFVARLPHRARQQFLDVALQVVIRRKPNRVLHPALFQRFIDLRFGKRSIRPKHYFLTHALLALDFSQKHFVPVLGTMHVARPQLRPKQSPFPLNSSSG
jgi:hypothetical protein